MGLVTLVMRPGHLILMNLWNADIENRNVNFILLPHLRVLDEISEVLDERQSVTVEDLEKLNYLEQVSLLSLFSLSYCTDPKGTLTV